MSSTVFSGATDFVCVYARHTTLLTDRCMARKNKKGNAALKLAFLV
jgi:hypothetical protein